jgi:hypothetical protein
MSGWIGVDLDGTLAIYGSWKGHEHIGEPIELMVERVKYWLAQGQEVRIVTARAGVALAVPAIKAWCEKHIGQELAVTDRKDFEMVELWDDRAVRVEHNTGKIVGYGSIYSV